MATTRGWSVLHRLGIACNSFPAQPDIGVRGSKDLDRAQRVAHAIKAGTVWINTRGLVNDAFEEGGFKYSGVGRARGARAMDDFQEVKTQVRLVAPESAGRSDTHTSQPSQKTP